MLTHTTRLRSFGAVAVAVALLVLMVAPVDAGGRGKGKRLIGEAACTVDGATVRAVGLPDDQVINFMLTDASGTTGWVLGTSSWWNVPVPDRTGPTTYEFVSRTWGKNGSKYTVFASCSA